MPKYTLHLLQYVTDYNIQAAATHLVEIENVPSWWSEAQEERIDLYLLISL
jgi:hypothetical protein